MNAFQSFALPTGDMMVCDGSTWQPSSGTLIRVGSGGSFSATLDGGSGQFYQPIASGGGASFVGGSGRNLTCEGLPAASSSAVTPSGWFRPSGDGFKNGIFSLSVTDPDNSEISDGTNVVAILTTGGAAPAGDYDSTAYGQATYGRVVSMVRQPFTLTVTAEDPMGGDIPNANVFLPLETFRGGQFSAMGGGLYESDIDPDWTILVDPSGSSQLLYLTDVIAERAVGSADDPSGQYVATTLGREFKPITPETGGAAIGGFVDDNPFGILTITYSWAAEVDLETRTEFLSGVVGEGVSLADYMTWGGADPIGPPGNEVVTIDLATAWDDGVIVEHADIFCFADWNPAAMPSQGKGPASLDVSYSIGGTVFSGTIRPGQASPVATAVRSFRVLSDGSVVSFDASWFATVQLIPRAPRIGTAYVEIVRTSGTLTAVNGPFFNTSMPGPSGDLSYIPLAVCDGFSVEQLHSGMIII